MPGKVRRIVTANRPDGRSFIESDTLLPPVEVAQGEPLRVGLWLTDRAPASMTVPDPVADGVILRTPPECRGGSVLRITDIPPDASSGCRGPEELRQCGANVTPDRSARHPRFHQPDTVDAFADMAREPSYAAQLGVLPRRRDCARLRAFLFESAQRFGDARQVRDVQAKSDEEMEELLHRMILARPDLIDLHRDSREWLFRHGSTPSASPANAATNGFVAHHR